MYIVEQHWEVGSLIALVGLQGFVKFCNRYRSYRSKYKARIYYKEELNLLFGLFNDRITFDGAVYREDTDDLITRVTTSNASGISLI
jgi:hypothetical protein